MPVNFPDPGVLLLVLLFIGSTHLTDSISVIKYPEYVVYQKMVPKFIPGIFVRLKDPI